MDLIDIHCHVLPRVDDGAKSVDESDAILAEAYRQGVRSMIATPHYRPGMFEPSMGRVRFSYDHLKPIAKKIGIELYLGCEMHKNEEILDLLDKGLRPTLAGSRYVLLEFSGSDSVNMIRSYVYSLISHGYKVIIAHIERYVFCQDLKIIEELKAIGALIQINAGSVLGEDGRQIAKFCMKMLQLGLVDFIGSDTHNTDSRPMKLGSCYEYVRKKYGEAYAVKIFNTNPGKILEVC